MHPSSRPTSTVRGKKRGPPNEIGHSRGGASSKIHAVVDTYEYLVSIMLSEGQRSDINYAIPMLEWLHIEGSQVVADRGYDSTKLLDYLYSRKGEPTIPSRNGAKFERRCDWWLYKERHLVEKFFSNGKLSVELLPVMTNWRLLIWALFALPQS